MDIVQLRSNDDSCITWVWVGELDVADCTGLRRAWASLVREDTVHIVIDTTAVTFMDCSVLSCLVRAKVDAGARLSVQVAPGPVAELLDMTGLGRFMAMSRPDDVCEERAC